MARPADISGGTEEPHPERRRILFLIDEMEALTAGGTERQVLQMIRLLEGTEFEPELCLLRGTKWLDEAQAHCPVYHADVPGLLKYSGLRELGRLLGHMRRRNYAIVQTFFVEANLIGPVLARLAGVKVIIGSRRNSNYWMSRGYAAMQRVTNRWATRLQANCEAVRKVVAGQEAVSPAKIDVLYNSLDTDRFRRNPGDRGRIRALIGAQADEVVVTNVSALRHPKGMDLFVRAGVAVLNSAPKARLLVVGDGPQRASLEAMVPSGLAARVYFAGAQEEVAPWLSASDVAVLSSESEGLSNSILEYMAAGLPVIATDVGGNAEALGATGILVPSGDDAQLAGAVLRCVNDRDLRETLGRAATQRVEQTFAISVVRSSMLAYYRDLLRAGSASAARAG